MFFSQIIDNEEDLTVPLFDLGNSALPAHFIIEKPDNIDYINNILSQDKLNAILNEEIDMKTVRNYIPNSLTLMLGNKCVTNCIYCYANTSHKVDSFLSLKRIKELIREAYNLGMSDFEIGGGDFFVYPNWEEVLNELHKYSFEPFISTKFPIDEKIVEKLLKNNVRFIQLSIDSIDNKEIQKILNVKEDYLDKVLKGVKLLNDAGIGINIKPVITKYNDSESSLLNLIEYFSKYEMVKNISIAPAAHSMYKPFNYATSSDKLDNLKKIINNIEHKYNFPIIFQGYEQKVDIETKEKSFNNRSLCSGNVTSFYILPDGKVTICEQMYWHPFFILGDVTQQSIMDVWISDKALSLWNYNQDEVREESPCKKCEDFEKCRRGRGNCWRCAIAAYGNDNFDYPAPNCPKALPVERPYYII